MAGAGIAGAAAGVLGLTGSTSSGGSINSAQNVSNSEGAGQGHSSSYSRTYGTEASMLSREFAKEANAAQMVFAKDAQSYNSTEAALQRAWQQINADTIYSRSVKDMINAGINPILAANFGLSAANVGSGAAASISVPSSHMAQAFPDVVSSSESEWTNTQQSHAEGYSNGSSWNEAESGLATGLAQLGNSIENGLNALSSAKFFDITTGSGKTATEVAKSVSNTVKEKLNNAKEWLWEGGGWQKGKGYTKENPYKK